MNTPETDAETMRDEWDHVDSDFGPFGPSDSVPADFARKLERERDEARAEMIRWMSIAEGRGRTDDEEENDTQAELAEAREQRDRLAEALERIRDYQGLFVENDPQSVATEALQSITQPTEL